MKVERHHQTSARSPALAEPAGGDPPASRSLSAAPPAVRTTSRHPKSRNGFSMKVWLPATCATVTENNASGGVVDQALTGETVITRLAGRAVVHRDGGDEASGGANDGVEHQRCACRRSTVQGQSQEDTAATVNALITTRPTPRDPGSGGCCAEWEREVQRGRVQQSGGAPPSTGCESSSRFESRQERYGDADDHDQCGSERAAVGDGGDQDGVDDDEDQFHAPIVLSKSRRARPVVRLAVRHFSEDVAAPPARRGADGGVAHPARITGPVVHVVGEARALLQ